MKKSTAACIQQLVGFTFAAVQSGNTDDFITENCKDLSDNLQLVYDFNLEELVDAAMYTLWLSTADEQQETDIITCAKFFIQTCQLASNYGGNIAAAISSVLNPSDEELQQEAKEQQKIDFLNKCLSL